MQVTGTEQLAARVCHARTAGSLTLVLMHFLGGSAREWDEVVALLSDSFTTVALDLPGFGESAGVPGYSVAAMADSVEQAIAEQVSGRYILVGHSMSGKVAMVLAARADANLAGLLLVAPSPPSPEPFTADKRSMMLELLGTVHGDDLARARSYITKNELRDIYPEVEQRASAEVLKMNRAAWVAWLQAGSKEDWADRVGVLDLPAMVVAGEKDLSLGPPQQTALTLPHLRQGVLRTVPNCSHLVPMECASTMATLIREFARSLTGAQSTEQLIPEQYRRFIASDRVSEKTREVLAQRVQSPLLAPGFLTDEQMTTLRALIARVIPQEQPALDLAGYVLMRLASGKGDGWRFDVLPDDLNAYRQGLDRLAAAGFAEMSAEAQDRCLAELAAHRGSAEARWFEEVRGDATAAYVAHPATLARLGYSGIGVGGAHTVHQGYVTLGPNQREDWEPEPSR